MPLHPFCFNPRTHIGCDSRQFHRCSMVRWFQSTHPHRVRHCRDELFLTSVPFQSTHPHRVRQLTDLHHISHKSFNPRTHIGCDYGELSSPSSLLRFNPRTHIGCDARSLPSRRQTRSFNPRTHIGCDTWVTQ